MGRHSNKSKKKKLIRKRLEACLINSQLKEKTINKKISRASKQYYYNNRFKLRKKNKKNILTIIKM
jgi:hypothetical protein